MNAKLIKDIRSELKRAANPRKAPQMQAYMKSQMPYLGVDSPTRKELCKKLKPEARFASAEEWADTVKKLWNQAQFREERYMAMWISKLKVAQGFQTLKVLPLYEHMIVDGAWWDYVDDIAEYNVGGLLKLYPSPMKKKMLAWSRSSDIWKRRTSIICQLKFKEKTDLALLYKCIEPSLHEKEFFLQKAIGWALREYAWTDAKEIRKYVAKNQSKLSNLSVREALKNIG